MGTFFLGKYIKSRLQMVGLLLSIFSIILAGWSFFLLTDVGTAGPGSSNETKEFETVVEQLRELSTQAASDTVGDTERRFIGQELEQLDNAIRNLEDIENSTSQNRLEPLIMLLIKLGFSLLFGGSALYVVLSRKYTEEIQKWAISVLSLISGVWIGTAS